mgnify:CR=1 FL=1
MKFLTFSRAPRLAVSPSRTRAALLAFVLLSWSTLPSHAQVAKNAVREKIGGIDLVISDIEMPRMDGYEVAQNMKADSRLNKVPIMMITSRTGDKHRQRAFDLGVERYLGKPYQELELMRQVNEIFKK